MDSSQLSPSLYVTLGWKDSPCLKSFPRSNPCSINGGGSEGDRGQVTKAWSSCLKMGQLFFFLIFICFFIWLREIFDLLDSLVAVHRLSRSTACRILVPWPGIKPTVPILHGGFTTTGQPGKPQDTTILKGLCNNSLLEIFDSHWLPRNS